MERSLDEEAQNILIEMHIGLRRYFIRVYSVDGWEFLTGVSLSKYLRLGTCHNSCWEIEIVRNAE
jgi:hypothetical protein